MKVRVPVYESRAGKNAFYKAFANGPVGYFFVDPENPVMSYSTYRRLMRLRIYSWSYLFVPSCFLPDYEFGNFNVLNPDGTTGDQFVSVVDPNRVIDF